MLTSAASRLHLFALINLGALVTVDLVLIVIDLSVVDSPLLTMAILVMSASALVQFLGLLLVRAGRLSASALTLTVAAWIAVVGTAYFNPFLVSIASVALLVPVVIVFEFLPRRQLIAVVVGTVMLAGLIGVLGTSASHEDTADLAGTYVGFLATFIPMLIGIICIGLWLQYRRLTAQAAELESSRRRLSTAFDTARRSIERDLHDGAQQRLVAISVDLGRIRRHTTNPETAGEIANVQTALTEAIQELRNLAHGIYPPLLLERGLPAALPAAGRRCPIPTTVHVDTHGRYEPSIESAVYFSCLEAIQNATKHSGATAITVTVTDRAPVATSSNTSTDAAEGEAAADHRPVESRPSVAAAGATRRTLTFEVADDGQGFQVADRITSPGLAGMLDRVRAAGGELTLESAPARERTGERTTTIRGSFPDVVVTPIASPGRR